MRATARVSPSGAVATGPSRRAVGELQDESKERARVAQSRVMKLQFGFVKTCGLLAHRFP